MRRSALADALAERAGRHAATDDRSTGPSPAEERLVTEFPFVLPRGYVDAAGTGAPRRGDAAGHRPRRAGAAARRPGAREPGVPDRRAARPGRHPDRHGHRRPRGHHGEPLRRGPGLPPGPLPPGQPGGPHPGRGHLPGVRPRRSPSTSLVGAWGNRDVRRPRRSTRRSRTSPTTSAGPARRSSTSSTPSAASTSTGSRGSTPVAGAGDPRCGGRGARRDPSRRRPTVPTAPRTGRRPLLVTRGAPSHPSSAPRTSRAPSAASTASGRA